MFIHTISTLVGSVWYATIVYLTLVCYTAVFSVVPRPAAPPGGAPRHYKRLCSRLISVLPLLVLVGEMRLWTAPIWLLGTIITTSFRFQLSRTQIPRASWSVGDHPLTKEPEDSKYEIAFPAPLSLVILRWWKRDPRKGNVIINVGLSYIIPENLLKFFPKFPPSKALKFFLEMSKILQKLSKIPENS